MNLITIEIISIFRRTDRIFGNLKFRKLFFGFLAYGLLSQGVIEGNLKGVQISNVIDRVILYC